MEFEPTAQAEAEKINRQVGVDEYGMKLVTDQKFWEKQGIYTGEELAVSLLNSSYSDYYKEVHGFRPRHTAFTSVQDAQKAIDDLDRYYMSMLEIEEIEIAKQEKIKKERQEIEALMPDEFDFDHMPTRSGMGKRTESKKMNKVTLAEALGLAKPAKKLSRKDLRNLILSEIRILAEQDKEDKDKDDASTLSDEEAVKAIEDNIPGKGVTAVVDFLNSPLGTDPKVREFIRKGSEDGDPSDEQITVGSGSPKVGDMVPTQNEIDLMKSISFPLSSIDALDNAMGSSVAIGDIIASGEHIIDGHHRWSSVASVNPDASLKVIDLGLPGSADTKLAVAQVAIAAQPEVGTKPVPKATTAGAANNILGKGAGAIKEMILARVGESSKAGELLNDEIVNHIKTKYANKFGIGEGDDMETVREKIADTVGKNLAAMKAGEGPERAYMPQFTGGDTGPSLDAGDVMGTLSGGDANYKEPIKQEAKRQDGVILERWQKLAGLLQD